MSVRYIVLSLCIFFVGGVLGALITSSSLGNIKKDVQSGIGTSQTVDTTSSNYQAGFNAARKLVEESSVGNFFKTQDDIRSVSGAVTAIDGNRITIHDESMSNPFDVPNVSDKIVIIDTNTKVSKFVREETKTPTGETNGLRLYL